MITNASLEIGNGARDYQSRAIEGVRRLWTNRVSSVCLVCPTGGGKTLMGSHLALSVGGPVLWVAHRRELVTQAAARLSSELNALDVSTVVSGGRSRHDARVHVGTVQTLLAAGWAREPSVLVLDEAHHYAAEQWRELATRFPGCLTLGLTATPERQDGKPLGDLFSALVVAAQYSELISAGHLCETVTYRPADEIARALASNPVEAYQKYGQSQQAFAFFSTIKDARQWALKFTEAGVAAECVDAKTPTKERAKIISRFASGDVRVLTNVHTLTEGVDIPQAGCVILGRAFGHVGSYLQAVGRVLRPYPGKRRAIVIDLTGATHKHGFATEDRIYSLEGDGIRRVDVDSGPAIRNCLSCGLVYLCGLTECPECGAKPPPRVQRPQAIYSLELQEIWAGENTRDDAKARELQRLLAEQRARGWSLDFVVKEYRSLFGSPPDLRSVPIQARKEQYKKWREFAKSRGFKPQFAAVRYKEMFLSWPGREITS